MFVKRGRVAKDRRLVAYDYDKPDERSAKVAPALRGEHGGHHAPADSGRREFGRYDRCPSTSGYGEVRRAKERQAYDEPPDDVNSENVDGVAHGGYGLGEAADDDYHELDTVYGGGQETKMVGWKSYTVVSDQRHQQAIQREFVQEGCQ